MIMKTVSDRRQSTRTLLSFILIPLSGFATDVYLPSLPSMAGALNTTNAAAQLTLVFFLVSYGISQLFVGSLLDSFGRFKLNLIALLVFSLSCFTIAVCNNIYIIYGMRILQGITVALVVVGKRAYFVDVFSGEKLKHYTSLFSIIWASAPIIAPFIGGYLQTLWGWESNFYFLGIFAIVIFILELVFGGESLKDFHPFKLKSILDVYSSMLRTTDFSLGIVILGCCYGILMVFGMSSPFIIEHVYGYSPVITGYCALISGVALMIGGMLSKALIGYSFQKKIISAAVLLATFSILMITLTSVYDSLILMMSFVILIHLLAGFIFNNFFSYCLGRFAKNAGIASGITGGALYIVTSILSYSIINTLHLKIAPLLATAYLILAIAIGVVFAIFIRIGKRKATSVVQVDGISSK
jgi:DHA1 family bicyclomycin/chloramphenicol resistance-like MFS transporter